MKFYALPFVILLCANSAALAELPDYPNNTVVHGTTDHDSIWPSCKLVSATRLKCQMVQVHVTKKHVGDWTTHINELVSAAMKDESPNPQTCAVTKIREQMKSNKEFQSSPKGQRDDFIEMLRLYENACRNWNRKNVQAMISHQEKIEQRTCRVWANSWIQEFNFQPMTGNWVSDSTPEGECGVVHVSVWKKVKASVTDFWTYTTQKVVTNKEGVNIFGSKCSEALDEPPIRLSGISIFSSSFVPVMFW